MCQLLDYLNNSVNYHFPREQCKKLQNYASIPCLRQTSRFNVTEYEKFINMVQIPHCY